MQNGRRSELNAPEPSTLFQCHSRRVKKLAVEVGNPNVVWSASEDGTLRQHDFREGASCPPAGSSHQDCHNVLLDLRCGAKKSLADSPKQCLALKSCDISTTRPHQLLVGGSDAFGRLYDRRMLPPLSSCQKRMKPPPCVDYFCPMHLSDRGRSNLHLTHVTFSPDGEEVLLSYSGEHVYLMDVNAGGESSMRYRAGDVAKQMDLDPLLSGAEPSPSQPILLPTGAPHDSHTSSRIRKSYELVQAAEKSLEGPNYSYGIEACSEVLDGNGPEIGTKLKHDCLCTRAALFLKRKWKNDVHMAIRDCNRARAIDSSSFRAHFYMADALTQLGKHKEALDYAMVAHYLAPSNLQALHRVESIKEHLAAAEAEKSNDGTSKGEVRSGRIRSLSDVLYRSEANSDASQDGPRSEREDSDYEEEMELDFETSISGDEGRDIESGILRGSLNLRFHRRSDSTKEKCSTNGSCGSPSSSSQNESMAYRPEVVIDMKQRYVGHCNVGTDIKQANFLGQRGEYVASGSDDGRWFIWEKRTGRLIKMLAGDEAVVNCIQCHPFDCTIATSGIDSTIKIWTPCAEVPSMVAGGAAGPETADVLSAMENNQNKLCRNRDAVLPFELLERFRMHDFAEGTLHPFECAQS
ncbi:protein ALTERED SEED GERMINATION 2 isoform X2 [Magnolia sinica]|uniref:protein ALTERED SEED GERMINATION 2 isoform X2 n=1 Tax=Magnolia sinica TaxID=86752 RepID=UPI00265AAEFE|nr:protein ALTERED SEED GERMINATION 2 isoform X2 [Magnolia sinica]